MRAGNDARCSSRRRVDVQEIADALVNIKRKQSGLCAERNGFPQRVKTLDEIFQRSESHVNRQLGTHTGAERVTHAHAIRSYTYI